MHPLLLLAAAHAGAPSATTPADPAAESAAFAWADKCPATAMQAGLYEGGGFARVKMGERTMIRFSSRAPAPKDIELRDQETTWMLGSDCRAVGLTRLGSERQGGTAHLGFVVAKEEGAPTAVEQAVLLSWAGKRDWDATNPAHAAATAAFVQALAIEESPGGDLPGTLIRGPAREWRDGPVPTQEVAWRPGKAAPDGTLCPCWELFEPNGPSKTQRHPWVAWHFGGLGGATVTFLEDKDAVRWAVEPPRPYVVGASGARPLAREAFPPPELSTLEAAFWVTKMSATLSMVDPATGAAFSWTFPHGVTPYTAVTAAFSTEGVVIAGRTIPSATLTGWLAR